jgi:hypothetical protein
MVRATGKNFYGWLYTYSFQRLQKISPSRPVYYLLSSLRSQSEIS